MYLSGLGMTVGTPQLTGRLPYWNDNGETFHVSVFVAVALA